MSSLDTSPLVQLNSHFGVPATTQAQKKAVHYIEEDSGDEQQPSAPVMKKQRHSDGPPVKAPKAAAARKPRTSMPAKPTPRKRSAAAIAADQDFPTEDKVTFCADLLSRMLSGPGELVLRNTIQFIMLNFRRFLDSSCRPIQGTSRPRRRFGT